VQLAPRPLRHFVASGVGESEGEALWAKGALLQAAEALVGKGVASTIHPTSSGIFQAKVHFAYDKAAAWGSGPSAALALFTAWNGCLRTLMLADRLADSPLAGAVTSPGQRRSRSAPRPTLTEH
jgi:hypothetical protein